MAAGDAMFVGWKGSPLTKELTPRLAVVPVFGASGVVVERVRRQLTRNILCLDKDKEAVIQGLQTSAVLSLPVVAADGSETTTAFGGGWKLTSLSDAKAAVGIAQLSVTYEKLVDAMFAIDLPAGVSITCVDGKCRILYNAVLLEELDSGTGICTSGLSIESSPDRSSDVFDALNRGGSIEYQFLCNGVPFDTHTLTIANVRRTRPTTHRAGVVIGGPYNTEPTAEQIEAVRVAAGASRATVTSERIRVAIKQTNEAAGQVVATVQEVPYLDGIGGTETETLVEVFQTYQYVTRYFIVGDYMRAQLAPSYRFEPIRPEWELTATHLRIKVENLVLREWEIGGVP